MTSSPPRHCLLVVDDEPNICEAVRDLLRLDFRVLTAHSAAEETRIMTEHEVHIVMTDQRIPQVTGVQLLESVRAHFPQAVRMLFTGYSDSDSIIDAVNRGHIFGFLRKPWEPEELESAVRESADEYDRIVEKLIENERLRAEVADLRQRVAALDGATADRDPG
ncbi:MAG: response regulator [Deltaproteobacteria bacterium]|nr:response regulator [Deltaproteobacteria bacterium]